MTDIPLQTMIEEMELTILGREQWLINNGPDKPGMNRRPQEACDRVAKRIDICRAIMSILEKEGNTS